MVARQGAQAVYWSVGELCVIEMLWHLVLRKQTCL